MTRDSMKTFSSRTVGTYLSQLASGSPAPGGGSAAGLAGAMGCCLGEMVCNLTLARVSSDAVVQFAEIFAQQRAGLLGLAERDERVFQNYRDAVALPKSTEEETAVRREAIEQALIDAAVVPLEMIETGLAALETLCLAASASTPHALGDLKTGGYLLRAMMLGSLENIVANASLMKVPANRDRYMTAADSARRDLEAKLDELLDAVTARTY